MTIPTVQSIRRARRFQDRRCTAAARVIAAMANGANLHLTLTKSRSNWTLSDGTSVTPEIALMVVNDVHVVDVNDGLFPTTSQTWRYIGF
jgi:hypothetical protein